MAAKSTWVEIPEEAGIAAAWCYSDRRSYDAGERVSLCISSNLPAIAVRVYRDGLRPDTLIEWEKIDTVFQPTPATAYMSGCGWQETLSIELPQDAAPGAYLVELRHPGSKEFEPPLGHHIFFVRAANRPHKGAILLVAST
jgi:hypothetical protein